MDLKKISKQISEDIDQYCIDAYDDGFRWHLGASIIGNKCSRYIWYVFRWCFNQSDAKPKKEDFARSLRLFQRGHLEELRYIEYLKGIGANVFDRTDDGKQYRISGCNGHFGGSLDSVVILPEKYGIKEPLLAEYKTNGTGAGFNNLFKYGVKPHKPVHYSQMSIYGGWEGYKFKYALYLNTNKNDDQLYVELVELDANLPKKMEEKAWSIINLSIPPDKISDNADCVDCRLCAAIKVCQFNKDAPKNCRSCKHSRPVDEGEWFCTGWMKTIPRDVVKVGCEHWSDISKLQPEVLPI